eukprot:7024203-Alexandrium_andersonii.AAC.1
MGSAARFSPRDRLLAAALLRLLRPMLARLLDPEPRGAAAGPWLFLALSRRCRFPPGARQ